MAKTDFIVDREALEVRLIRVYDAPRAKVWAACTDPEQIPHWWGPAQYETTVDKLELKVGGVWRFVHCDAQGNEFAFRGEYLEIAAPERVVNTFEFEQMPGHVVTETATFEELPDGKTRLTAVSKYANIQDLDGMVASGMEGGAVESRERLGTLVEA